MNGYRSQPILQNFAGVGSASIIHSASTEINQTDLSSITGSQSNVTSGGYTTNVKGSSKGSILYRKREGKYNILKRNNFYGKFLFYI